MGNVVVGVCYRLPEEEAVVYEAFFTQLEKVSHFQLLDLMRNLMNHPNVS